MGLFQTVVLENDKRSIFDLTNNIQPFHHCTFSGIFIWSYLVWMGSNTFGYSEVIFQDKIIMFLVITT